jgi:hypothetical protein
MNKKILIVENRDSWNLFKSREHCTSLSQEKIPAKFKTRRPKEARELAEKLFAIAGQQVCIDKNLGALTGLQLTAGRLFNNYHITVWKKEQHGCHANSAKIWNEHPNKYSLVTGFVFAEGIWVPHSWLIRNNTKKIVDTIYKFDKYFGLILNTELAQSFYRSAVGKNKNNHRSKK